MIIIKLAVALNMRHFSKYRIRLAPKFTSPVPSLNSDPNRNSKLMSFNAVTFASTILDFV